MDGELKSWTICYALLVFIESPPFLFFGSVNFKIYFKFGTRDPCIFFAFLLGLFSTVRVNAGHSTICQGQMAETNGLR